VVFFIVTLDTTCVSTALPKIAADLNAGSSITWVGTSLLVASTTTQVIVSRLSDIFGRKVCLQVSLAIFALGNLLCGFAQSPGWLYAARGVAGIGAGGVSSLCLIVITDVVSLRERGKYISMMGIPTALGLGLGPEIGGVLADRVSWRWVFWIIVPVAVVALPIIQFFLPLKPVPGNIREKLKMVDWWGSLAAFAAIILLLVPISAGGSSFAWSSTESVVMLVFGSVLMLVFLVIEYYHPLPIMPLHLFRNRTVALVLATMFLVGIVWNGNFYMAPLYFQNVLGYNPVAAGALMVPLLVGQIIVMTAAGYALQKWGRARTIILLGYLVWTAGQGMQIAWGVHKNLALIIAAMAVQGIGFGSTSQTTLVLAQASCDSADRAVVTGLRVGNGGNRHMLTPSTSSATLAVQQA
jgi:MFS family permease